MGASSNPNGSGDDGISGSRIPYRLRTPRLVLRPYAPEDAPLLRESMAKNKTHLEAWMPWARNEPMTLEQKLDWILEARASFDLEKDYRFALFDPDSGAFIGSSGLHLRVGPRAAELGYWIDRDRCGEGLASEATCALTQVGFENLALARIEIHCDPENVASAKIPVRLGYREEGILRSRFAFPDGTWRDTQIFSQLVEEYRAGPLSHTALERFDALGNRLTGYPAASIESELQ